MLLKDVPFGKPFRFVRENIAGIWMRLRSVDSNIPLSEITITCLSDPIGPHEPGETSDAGTFQDRQVELVKCDLPRD
jgi:hypothetical protein